MILAKNTIHSLDFAGIEFLLERPTIVGPMSFCAPEYISQKEFAAMLAKSMN